MAKASARKSTPRGPRRQLRSSLKGGALLKKGGRGGAKQSQPQVGKARFEAVMQAAEQSGFLSEKSGRIGGRVSPALIRQAKRLTGIETDTDLIEFALATVALEDNFADAFRTSRGKVDRELKLGF
jgi:hypothetical protein